MHRVSNIFSLIHNTESLWFIMERIEMEGRLTAEDLVEVTLAKR